MKRSHLDLSYEGRQQASRSQIDNGKLPHGGHRGRKQHPLMYLSLDKGRDFQTLLDKEVERVLEEEEISRMGYTPSWSILLHKQPSYTDESVFMRQEFLAANKLEQSGSYDLFDPALSEGTKSKHNMALTHKYYRPNRSHQYLTATELRDFAESDVNINFGRPTRTTLLRARQRSNSAPQDRRDFLHHLKDIRESLAMHSTSQSLDLQHVLNGESLHSYLTGARYNRAHCLDVKNLRSLGVYLPRHEPDINCWFSSPKGLWYTDSVKHEVNKSDSAELKIPQPPPGSPRLQDNRPSSSTPTSDTRHPLLVHFSEPASNENSKLDHVFKPARVTKKSRLKKLDKDVVGNQLFVNGIKLPAISSFKKLTNESITNFTTDQSNSIGIGTAPEVDRVKVAVSMNQIMDSSTIIEVREDTELTSATFERSPRPQGEDTMNGLQDVKLIRLAASPIPEEEMGEEIMHNEIVDFGKTVQMDKEAETNEIDGNVPGFNIPIEAELEKVNDAANDDKSQISKLGQDDTVNATSDGTKQDDIEEINSPLDNDDTEDTYNGVNEKVKFFMTEDEAVKEMLEKEHEQSDDVIHEHLSLNETNIKKYDFFHDKNDHDVIHDNNSQNDDDVIQDNVTQNDDVIINDDEDIIQYNVTQNDDDDVIQDIVSLNDDNDDVIHDIVTLNDDEIIYDNVKHNDDDDVIQDNVAQNGVDDVIYDVVTQHDEDDSMQSNIAQDDGTNNEGI